MNEIHKAQSVDAKGDLGQLLIVEAGGGKNFWQPVPASGQISVRIAPQFVEMQSPFSMGTQTLPPNGYVREHAHPVHDEAFHCISGTGKVVLDGVEHRIEPGMSLFIGRNRRHMFVNDGDADLHWLWFIQPSGLEVFFEEIGCPVVDGEPDPTPFARPDNVLEIEQRTAFATPPLNPTLPKF